MDLNQLISKVDCWPNEHQMLLLTAALKTGNEAIDAWKEWLSKVDYEDTDNSSYRLYPLVYENLTQQNIGADQLPKTFKGAYRFYWSYTNRLFAKTNGILKKIQSNNIPFLILKGVPLALNYYDKLATRPLLDLDIMVKHEHADKAIAILNQNGYESQYTLHKNFFKWRHSSGFKNKENFEIDLHLSLTLENLTQEDQQTYWDNSVSMNLLDLEILTLCPTDHLFHTITHGLTFNDNAPAVRWIADAKIIIDKGSIDWKRLITIAKQNKVSVKVFVALKYLQENFVSGIPEEVFHNVSNNRFEEKEFIRKTKKLGRVRTHWYQYIRVRKNFKSLFPFDLASYLLASSGVKSIFHLPAFIFKKVLK